MRQRILIAMLAAAIFLLTGIVYAGNGDLIVQGNLGVGTSAPGAKAEVNGNLKVDGTVTNNGETVNGNSTISNTLTVTNGNITVTNGKVGIGTSSPTQKLDINGGTISVVYGGVRFTLKYANMGEDSYSDGTYSSMGVTDTCNGDGNNYYQCPLDEVRATCTDSYSNSRYYRYVTCKRGLFFVE